MHPGFPKFKSLLKLLLLAAAGAARAGLLLVCYRKGCLEKLDGKAGMQNFAPSAYMAGYPPQHWARQ